ncbi:MAG: response regulator [Aliidongia sp.]
MDDEPAIRRFLRVSLTAQGYRVIETDSGGTALEMARASAPDVIVLDLGLPDLDGVEVIRRLRGAGSMVPIIVLSSRVDEEGKVQSPRSRRR